MSSIKRIVKKINNAATAAIVGLTSSRIPSHICFGRVFAWTPEMNMAVINSSKLLGQYLKGIRVDEERLAEDVIMKVGPMPGTYMKERHKRNWYREEFLIPALSNRDFFEAWERGHTELQEKAKEKAQKIPDTYESRVAPEIQREIDDYLDFVRKRDVQQR